MTKPFHIRLFTPAAFSGRLSEEIGEDWIPGTVVQNASGPFGCLAVQSVQIGEISSHYIRGEVCQPVHIGAGDTASFVFLCILQQGNADLTGTRQDLRFCRPDHYSLLYLPHSFELRLSGVLPASGFKSLVIVYPVSFVLSLLYQHPPLQELSDRLGSRQPLAHMERSLSASLSETVYQLLHTPYAPMLEDYHYSLFRSLLTGVLKDYGTDVAVTVPFNSHDIGCLHTAKEYIDTHLREKLTISELARKAGINELKLKNGFKSLYGSGVHGYQVQRRLAIAREALEQTLRPIHQIARQAGYRDAPNFSIAFKKFYGLTPYQHRMNIRKQ